MIYTHSSLSTPPAPRCCCCGCNAAALFQRFMLLMPVTAAALAIKRVYIVFA